ncbi:hypothetical protein BU14_0733s0005 [Porphyra umbilicalis]|uniref:Signal recognition particle receptor alpha subunit N-terminal domain-containing protein n=1 Tax=Porphyra umbilicalis TaxID=2786 RepID=A0A1X6NPL2_PORUM|nr:hypothetical protein BU14_0733s0005 [Porphyra umbilicalis]|eukprot:OSX70522.1 hypothetical protein BU14_0733s0005 [Porphyra umbilicalis]
MIDLFSIIEAGGTILWQSEFIPLPSRPLDALVRRVLLAERSASSSFTVGPTTLRWALANAYGLVFVVAYPTRLPPAYKDSLLAAAKEAFVGAYGPALGAPGADVDELDVSGFDEVFRRLHADAEAAVTVGGGAPAKGAMAPYAGAGGGGKKRGKAGRKKRGGGLAGSDGEPPPPPPPPVAAAPTAAAKGSADGGGGDEDEDPRARLERARAAFLRKRAGGGARRRPPPPPPPRRRPLPPPASGKKCSAPAAGRRRRKPTLTRST